MALVVEGEHLGADLPAAGVALAAIGVDVVGTTPGEFAKIISDDYEKWGKVIAAAGIKPE